MGERIFLGNLDKSVEATDVRSMLSGFGLRVVDDDIYMKRDTMGLKGTGVAFVTVSSNDDGQVQKFIDSLNRTHWKGRTLRVEKARESFLAKLPKERERIVREQRVEAARREAAAKPGPAQRVVWKTVNKRQIPVLRLSKTRRIFSGRARTVQPSEIAARAKRINPKKSGAWGSSTTPSVTELTWDLGEEPAAEEPSPPSSPRPPSPTLGGEHQVVAVADWLADNDGDEAGNSFFHPELEGRSGRRLLALKRDLAGDERFKLTERFLEEGGESSEEEIEEEEAAAEAEAEEEDDGEEGEGGKRHKRPRMERFDPLAEPARGVIDTSRADAEEVREQRRKRREEKEAEREAAMFVGATERPDPAHLASREAEVSIREGVQLRALFGMGESEPVPPSVQPVEKTIVNTTTLMARMADDDEAAPQQRGGGDGDEPTRTLRPTIFDVLDGDFTLQWRRADLAELERQWRESKVELTAKIKRMTRTKKRKRR